MPIHLLQHPIFDLFIFLTGACIGSFLNVCIYRIPIEVSVIRPNSCCASCGTPIPWKNNIPILSWIHLRGRCHSCGIRIDFRYWVVEVLTAVVFLALWRNFSHQPAYFLIYALFFSGLLISSCIDLDHCIIPDRFTLGGIFAGMAISALFPSLHQETSPWAAVIASFRGAMAGGILLLAIAKIGTWVFKKDAMGLGDIKLLAAIGAFLGWKSTLFTIAFSSLLGSVAGIAIIIQKQKAWGLRMAYGPYLAIAAMAWLFGGKAWTEEYLKLWHYVFGQGS